MSGQMNGWPIAATPVDILADMSRQVDELTRRTRPGRPGVILGPGLSPKSLRIVDWNGSETTFNGFYYSDEGALNSPDDTKRWIGTVRLDEALSGVMDLVEFGADGLEVGQRWTRQFTANASGIRIFGPWRKLYPRARTVERITVSGTWTKPDGLVYAVVEAIGGGGGGGGAGPAAASQHAKGGGGGSGGYVSKTFAADDLGDTEPVTVGTGGSAGTVAGGGGGTGGTTTFGSGATLLTAAGGTGGGGGVSSATAFGERGGNGGAASGGDINQAGAPGQWGWGSGSLAAGGLGGSAQYGAGGAGSRVGAVGAADAGGAGQVPGGGGGGASTATTNATGAAGGAGGGGAVIVTCYFA